MAKESDQLEAFDALKGTMTLSRRHIFGTFLNYPSTAKSRGNTKRRYCGNCGIEIRKIHKKCLGGKGVVTINRYGSI